MAIMVCVCLCVCVCCVCVLCVCVCEGQELWCMTRVSEDQTMKTADVFNRNILNVPA